MRILILNPYARRPYGGPNVLMARLRDSAMGLGTQFLEVKPLLKSVGLLGQATWAVKALTQIMVQPRKPDVAHFHGAFLFNLVPGLACLARGIPYTILPLSENSDLRTDGTLSRIWGVNRLRRLVVSRAHGGLALSRGIGAELIAWGMPARRLVTLPNPPDLRLFELSPPARRSSQELIFVGKMGRRKAPDLVLHAVALAHEAGIEIRASFVGPFENAGYEREFRDLSRRLGVTSRIACYGLLSAEEIVQLYRRKHYAAFILPSSNEGLPGAMTEAMAAGVPVIVTDVGGMGDTVRESNGGLVVTPDPHSLTEAIVSLISNDWLWEQCAKAARQYAETNFHPERVAIKFIAAVNRTI